MTPTRAITKRSILRSGPEGLAIWHKVRNLRNVGHLRTHGVSNPRFRIHVRERRGPSMPLLPLPEPVVKPTGRGPRGGEDALLAAAGKPMKAGPPPGPLKKRVQKAPRTKAGKAPRGSRPKAS